MVGGGCDLGLGTHPCLTLMYVCSCAFASTNSPAGSTALSPMTAE